MAIGRHNWRVTSSDAVAHPAAPRRVGQHVPWLDQSHRRIVAVLVGLALLGDIALNIASTQTGTPHQHETPTQLVLVGTFLVAALVVAALLARWRHTRPIALMVAIIAFALALTIAFPPSEQSVGFILTLLLFALLGTYYVTLAHGTPTGVAWFVALLAAQVAGAALQQLQGVAAATWLSYVLSMGAFQGVLALVAIALASRRRYLQDLLERNRMLALERDQRAQLAVADERARIAAEMHDIVSHSLAVMVTLADGAGRCLPDDVPTAQEALGQIGTTGRAAVADMRRLLAFLRADAEREPQPDLAQLGGLIDQMRTAGLPVTLATDAALPDDPSLGLAVYRIVQEGLTNVLRHAPHTAWVRVVVAQPTPGRIEVQVINGPSPGGAGIGTGAGQGLVGVRQRVAVWDGDLRAGRTLEGGWDLRAQLRTDTHADDKE
ncbi:MAG: histidine kinase [Propionibacteriaceae bacterium]|nr:histidine kinase [Propionibacteriaceae bacterium]